MASGTRIFALFVGTTTASSHNSADAVLTLDLSSSPPGRTPTATLRSSSSAYAQSGSYSEASALSASSTWMARATDVSHPYSPAYDKKESTDSSSGLRISLIVLSVVLFVTALVIGWLLLRRSRRQCRKKGGNGLEGASRNSFKRPPVLRGFNGRQSGSSDLTYSVPIAWRDTRVAVPTHSIDHHHQPSSSEKQRPDGKRSLSRATFDKGAYTIEHPPKPPTKQTSKLPPDAPSPSLTFPTSQYSLGNSGVRTASPPPLELRRFSALSPVPTAPD